MTIVFDQLSVALRRLAGHAAMTAAYPNWDDEFSRKEVKEAWDDTCWGQKPLGFRFTGKCLTPTLICYLLTC